jgi:metacaspase-1
MRRGISLHVGLNHLGPHYPSSTPLNCATNDATALEEMARHEGFRTKCLLEQEATSTAVARYIVAASDQLTAGDYFLLSFAGHGAQIDQNVQSIPHRWPFLSLREEADQVERDGKDEVWCLWDRPIIDDEICLLLHRFKADVRVLLLIDCCSAGGVGPFPGSRPSPSEDPHPLGASEGAMPGARRSRGIVRVLRDDAATIARRNCDGNAPYWIDRSWIPASTHPEAHMLIASACGSDQLAAERVAHGAFTEDVITTWGKRAFTGDYRSFFAAIEQSVSQDALQHGEAQTPRLATVGAAGTFLSQTPFRLEGS